MNKKIKLGGVMLVSTLILTGCGQSTDYEQLVKDMGNTKSMQFAEAELGAAVDGFSLNYNIEMDAKNQLMHVKVAGFDVYLTSDTLYVQMLDNWFKAELTEEQVDAIQAEYDFTRFKIEMPDGDKTISINTGIEELDGAVNGKTLNDIVVSTDGGYTITGLDDYVDITVEDQILTLTFNNAEEKSSLHFSFGKGTSFKLPDEAQDAKELPADTLTE